MATYLRLGLTVAPTVGGEYFLSDHPVSGGEVQVRFTSVVRGEGLLITFM